MSSGIPSSIAGSGSLVITSCAVPGSTLIAARTDTVPRSNGPAIAGTTIAESERGALVRTRQVHRIRQLAGLGQVQRVFARTHTDSYLPDLRRRRARPFRRLWFRAARDVPQVPQQARGHPHRDRPEALLAVAPRERQRERAERPRLIARHARGERRIQMPARAGAAVWPRVDLEVRGLAHGGRATPRRQRSLRDVGAAVRRGGEQRPRTAVEAQLQFAKRQLRRVRERDRQAAGTWVRFDVTRELDQNPVAFGDHVQRQQRPKWIGALLGPGRSTLRAELRAEA